MYGFSSRLVRVVHFIFHSSKPTLSVMVHRLQSLETNERWPNGCCLVRKIFISQCMLKGISLYVPVNKFDVDASPYGAWFPFKREL